MPKGQKLIKNHVDYTLQCASCDRAFTSASLQGTKKFMELHRKKSHNVEGSIDLLACTRIHNIANDKTLEVLITDETKCLQ